MREPQICVPQIVTYIVVEKEMEYKGEQKVTFRRTVMQALELLWLAKRHVLGHSNID